MKPTPAFTAAYVVSRRLKRSNAAVSAAVSPRAWLMRKAMPGKSPSMKTIATISTRKPAASTPSSVRIAPIVGMNAVPEPGSCSAGKPISIPRAASQDSMRAVCCPITSR